MASEYVRKELKAVVGARTIQRGLSGPIGNLNQNLGSGPMNHSSPPMMVPGGKPLNQADLEALGLSYELPQGIVVVFFLFCFLFFLFSFRQLVVVFHPLRCI